MEPARRKRSGKQLQLMHGERVLEATRQAALDGALKSLLSKQLLVD
jgi:hypothetical protein